MRWRQYPRKGSVRIVRRYLRDPLCLDGECRQWEWAYIEQQAMCNHNIERELTADDVERLGFAVGWRDRHWAACEPDQEGDATRPNPRVLVGLWLIRKLRRLERQLQRIRGTISAHWLDERHIHLEAGRCDADPEAGA